MNLQLYQDRKFNLKLKGNVEVKKIRKRSKNNLENMYVFNLKCIGDIL